MSAVVAYLNQKISDAEILWNVPDGKGPAHNDQWHHWTIAHDRLEDELFSEPQRVAALARIALAAHRSLYRPDGFVLQWPTGDHSDSVDIRITMELFKELCEADRELSRVVDQQSQT